jgi:hypothetical protein
MEHLTAENAKFAEKFLLSRKQVLSAFFAASAVKSKM